MPSRRAARPLRGLHRGRGPDGSTWWGVGMDSSILDASLHAVVSAAIVTPERQHTSGR